MLDFILDIVVVGYTYSKTVHSVQGVTTPYTFVNSKDLQKCRGALKNILYVAYSRASSELHLVEI